MTNNLNDLALLGVDVGFSLTRATTGIAWCVSGRLDVVATYTKWDRRREKLPENIIFDVAAIDGPLVPAAAIEAHKRDCEYQFIRGTYALRCKPGLSHFGTGLKLRSAARETADQFYSVVDGAKSLIAVADRVIPDKNIIEAFPNAFLGVMLSDDVYAARPKLRRGKKFDWLYQQAVANRMFDRLLERLSWDNAALLKRLNLLDPRRHHEEAAALICLLTAACAATQNAKPVGEPSGGWFWMPPIDLWQDWAKDELATAQSERSPFRKGSLAEFLANSPLRGLNLEIPARCAAPDVDL